MTVGELKIHLGLDLKSLKADISKINGMLKSIQQGLLSTVKWDIISDELKQKIVNARLEYETLLEQIRETKNTIKSNPTPLFIQLLFELEQLADEAGAKLNDALKIKSLPLKALGALSKGFETLKKKISGAGKTFAYMFSRMLYRKLVNNIAKYITENVGALALFSKENGNGSYNNTLSNYITLFKKIAAYVALIGVKLLLWVEPVFNAITKAVQWLLGKLSSIGGGNTVINEDFWYDYADGVKETNKQVKQLLSGFDELNTLSENASEQASMFKNELKDSIIPQTGVDGIVGKGLTGLLYTPEVHEEKLKTLVETLMGKESSSMYNDYGESKTKLGKFVDKVLGYAEQGFNAGIENNPNLIVNGYSLGSYVKDERVIYYALEGATGT